MPQKTLSVSENTRKTYCSFLRNHVYPVIGDIAISEITASMLSALVLDYQKKYSYSSAYTLHTLLTNIFELAEFDQTVPLSPMLRVRRPQRPKDETTKAEVDKAYTAEDVRRILEATEREPLQWRVFIRVMLDTAARNGEVCGLQWKDVDFKAGRITIKRNLLYSPDKGVFVSSTKTGHIRTVDIGPDTVNLLHQLRREQAADCLSPFVFSRAGSSEPISPQAPGRYFKQFGEKYDIPDFHPHKLRHTSATLAIINGADIASVSKRLGHSDVATTLRIYTHASEESIRAAGQTVRDAIEKAQGQN